MKKWIEFNVNHPIIVIFFLAVITLLSVFGIRKLYFDSSTEALMPKKEILYKLGEYTKRIFLDSKTFLLVSVETHNQKDLFTYNTFFQLNELVSEIEDFKDFNYDLENKRLKDLIKVGNITYSSKEEASGTQNLKKSLDNENELDRQILSEAVENNADKKDEHNIWNSDKPIRTDYFAKPARNRLKYNYNKYSPIKLNDLEHVLDIEGRKQLKSILRFTGLSEIKSDQELTGKEFKKILEAWETVYLYKSMEIVKTFANPISGEDIRGTKDELKPVKFIEKDENGVRLLPRTENDFQNYISRLTRNPSFESFYYSIDSDHKIQALAFSIYLKPLKSHNEIFDYLYQVIEKYNNNQLILTQVGNPIFDKFIRDNMKSDLSLFMPLAIILIIIVFFLNFISTRGVLLPTISILIGTFWTMGLMGFLNIPITLVVNMLPPLLIAVGSSYSIHIFNQYLQDIELIRSQGKKYGIIESMNYISITVILAGFTTFVGFITLTTTQIESLKEFGIFAAIGTVLAVVISIMLIPSSLMLMKLLPVKIKKGNKYSNINESIKKFIMLLNRISLNNSKAVIIIYSIIMILAVVGIYMIKIESGGIDNFKENSYIYISHSRISEQFKGYIAMNFVVDSGKTDGVKDPEFLKIIEDVRKWITLPENQEKYLFLNTRSYGDIIKAMNMAMNNDKREFFTVPDNEMTIRDYFELYSGEDSDSDGRIDTCEQFIDPYYRYVNTLVFMGNYKGKPFSTAINMAGQKALLDYLKNNPSTAKYKWYLVGEPINWTILTYLIVKGQLINIITSLVIIALVIISLFKNIKVGLIALFPILTSVLIVYGIMGYLNISLDLPKAVLAAIAIGIGVDDTIHILKTIKYNLLKGLSIPDAITASHKEAGMAIVYTSIALIFGFAIFMLSDFRPVFYFGWLVVLTMIATTIGALLLLPSIIVFFNLKIDKEEKWRLFRYVNLDFLFKEKNK